MRQLTYNNSKRSMLSRDYTKSTSFIERNYAIFAAIFGSIAAFSIGTCIAWSSNAIDILSSKTFPLSFENMTTKQVAWIISVFTVGATLSPLVTFKLWRFIGSKFFILMGSGFLMTSWILLTIYRNFLTMLCARLLSGIAIGCLHFIMPVYIQDLASSELRFTTDFIWHGMLAAGIFVQYITALIHDVQWINLLSILPPFLLFFGFIFMPESPRYLCVKGNSNAAKEILRKFRELNDEFEQDIYVWCNKKFDTYSFRRVLKSSSNLRRLLPLLGLVVLEQLTGIWATFFYSSWIFRISGGEYSPTVTTIFIGGIYFVSTLIPKILNIPLSDKPTLIWTSILKAIALFVLGFYIHYQGTYGRIDDYEYIPLTCYGIFVFLNGICLHRVTWKLTRILIPKSHYLTIRAICTSVNWAILIFFTRSYPRLIELVGIGWMFWFMSLSCILLTIFSSILIPNLESLNTKYIFDEDDTSQHECEQQIED